MLSDEVVEKVIERVVNRIEQGNTYVLTEMGKTIKKIGTLKPSEAHQLVQTLKYGGDYDKIKKKLAQITNLSVNDIEKIFEEVAKVDYNFAKQFYDYRGKKFIPYNENLALKKQVDALARITANEFKSIVSTKALGFSVKDLYGNVVFKPLQQAYYDLLDKAILSTSQGKTTFQDEMYRTIKELASSGLKTMDYDTGRSVRLDSVVKMHLKDGIRRLHNETQVELGKDFDSDGVEITTHNNPAPDHEDAQGRQFSTKKSKGQKLSEWEKLQETGIAKDYTGKVIDLHRELKSGDMAIDFRPISTYNCYHYTFSIILGVNKPQYTDKELEQIKQDNKQGFELDGKHYTMYEGTQLQRQLETKIREQKDVQIMAKASDNQQLVQDSQSMITKLTRKYKELSNVSGLPTKMQRMRVSGYKRTAFDKKKK